MDLPVSHPDAKQVTVAFAATKKTSKFSLSAVLTGMAALIGGNPGIGLGHSKTATFQQLVAKGTRVELPQIQDLLKNSMIKDTLRGWLETKGQRVFIAGNVLTTTEYSVNVDSSTNIDASFNGSVVSKCNDANSGGDGAAKNGKSASKDSSKSATDTSKSNTDTSKSTPADSKQSKNGKNSNSNSTPSAANSSSTQPGGNSTSA